MTFEQTTRRILAATEVQNLAELQAAGKERARAIAMLASLPPSQELYNAVEVSIAAGEEARRAIRMIQQRLRNESRRLERIEHGFLRASLPAAMHRIDCQG